MHFKKNPKYPHTKAPFQSDELFLRSFALTASIAKTSNTDVSRINLDVKHLLTIPLAFDIYRQYTDEKPTKIGKLIARKSPHGMGNTTYNISNAPPSPAYKFKKFDIILIPNPIHKTSFPPKTQKIYNKAIRFNSITPRDMQAIPTPPYHPYFGIIIATPKDIPQQTKTLNP